MRWVRGLVLCVAASTTLALAQGGKGFEPMFNGKDLTGWKNYGVEKWYVDGGEIHGEAVTKEYGYLGTEKTYKNFEMKGKFKAEGTGNSGRHTGGIYGDGRQWIVWPNPEGEKAMKVGDWNDVQFSVNGNHIQTWVNGVKALDYTDPAPKFSDGIIALQLHAGGEGKMRFKDLYIRELP